MELQNILKLVEALSLQVGEFQLQYFRKLEPNQIFDKGLNQLVSFVDVESEKMLVAELSKILPNAGFITEENTVEQALKQDLAWIIDPLDGTTNFLHGLPAFCVSIALMKDNEIILGIVHAPVWGETFSAVKGMGAYLNGTRIFVSKNKLLSDSLIATGFPYYEFEYMGPYLDALRDMMKNTHGLRRMGSAAIDLAYTACGRFDGFFELGLNAWDVAAGALIVQEAGGVVADFSLGSDYIFGKRIIASNAIIYHEFQTLLSQKFL